MYTYIRVTFNFSFFLSKKEKIVVLSIALDLISWNGHENDEAGWQQNKHIFKC